jgi:hypothetical protein
MWFNRLKPFPIRLLCFFNLTFNLAIYSSSSFAQPVSASVNLEPSTAGFVNGTCYLTLSDSTSCTFISVELTDRISDSTLFSREYAFDEVTGLPNGITWFRQGLNVTLGVGILPVKSGWTGKIRLKNTAGEWSSAIEFLFQ